MKQIIKEEGRQISMISINCKIRTIYSYINFWGNSPITSIFGGF